MNKGLQKLSLSFSPPSKPSETGIDSQWSEVEQKLGWILPSDYKALIENYGTGCWLDFLWVLNPFSENVNLNLLDQAEIILEGERLVKSKYPDMIPFVLHPEKGGLFPWAITDNGDRLFWLTDDETGVFQIVVYESRGPEYEVYDLSCSEFLLQWLSGELRVGIFPDEFEYNKKDAFTPYQATFG